jgi:tetratricopeptide (TPR) repeat protein
MPSHRPCLPALILLIALACFACSAANGPAGAPSAVSLPEGASPDEKALFSAQRDITHHQPEAAIATLDPLIDRLALSHRGGEMDVYCTRSIVETMQYMLLAQSQGRNAVAIDATWSEAYYYKAYALIELGRIQEARAMLEKARALSPRNSQYLSELAHTWHAEREWQKALDLFAEAEKAAAISPPEVKHQEMARALRGQGFSLIELGRLDEAEAKFNAALAIDRHDVRAKNELAYIEQLRRKQ